MDKMVGGLPASLYLVSATHHGDLIADIHQQLGDRHIELTKSALVLADAISAELDRAVGEQPQLAPVLESLLARLGRGMFVLAQAAVAAAD